MGYLAAAGAYLIIGLVVSFILMVVGLFIGHIIVFDSIALGIISGVCCNHFFTLSKLLVNFRFVIIILPYRYE